MNVRLVTDDLLFGSKVEAMIREAGGTQVGGAQAGEDAGAPALTILDLTDTGGEVERAVVAAKAIGAPVLAYYAHTEDDVRQAALAAGVDKLVPRSRMMREGADLIRALASGS